ncbi:MAG: FkbM family methyltransferase [Gammaproteobacteria bacterium]
MTHQPPVIDAKLRARLFLVKLFDALCSIPKWNRFHRILRQHAATRDDFFFVQIGANDGVIYDPIHVYVTRQKWRGILVEPVTHCFNKLKANYSGNANLLFENVAISDKEEVREFYRIREGQNFLPKWCEGLGTFYPEVLLTHKWALPNIEEYMVKEAVRCISLSSLLRKHAVSYIDLFLIDTEGHDYQILKQLDFATLKPTLIVFEHQYFSKGEREACASLLAAQEYSVCRHLGNTLAFQPA